MSDGVTMTQMPAPHPASKPVSTPAPAARLLPTLSGPAALRDLDAAQLRQLCREIRTTIIETVATTGGHLGSSLGAVELAVALHRLLDSPRRGKPPTPPSWRRVPNCS
jgi:1-deoxy-D-xylulose-5-phosphate synthase